MAQENVVSALYVGLSGLALDGDTFDLGDGVTIRKAYGHLMLPLLMAFSPAERGKAHPAPWRTVEGSGGIDMHAELYVPGDVDGIPASEVGRVIVSLLRLGVDPRTTVPVVASHSLSEFPKLKEGEGRISPLEYRPRTFRLFAEGSTKLNDSSASWVREKWKLAHKLMTKHAEFGIAVAAMDAGQFERNTALTLISLWGALEALFAGDRSELRFRVSSYIASYLAHPGEERAKAQKRIAKLYDKRSAAAHGSPNHESNDVFETFVLMRESLIKILAEGKLPTREDLDALLFGAS